MKEVNIIVKFLCLIVMDGLLFACTLAEVEERTPSPTGEETVEAQFTIQVKSEESGLTKASGDSLQTRAASAMTDVEERAIKTLWVGQYVNGALQNAGLTGAYISSVDLTLIKVLLKASSERSTVYLITNAGDLGTPTEAVLKTMIRDYGSSGSAVEAGVRSNGLVMLGKWEGTVNASFESGTPFQQTVTVERVVTKVRFKYSLPTVSGFSFTPTSLTLKSVPNGSRYLEPDGQLSSGITYVDIPASSAASKDEYWYIPENKAGRGVTTSEKEKIGTNKTNATYIELMGDAVQNGVTYKNVSFKFYPGSDSSDYTLRRNHFYDIGIAIRGIDFTDKRVTVGGSNTNVNSLSVGAVKGATDVVTMTVQPGKTWNCTFPDWLAASGSDITQVSATQITGRGPVPVTFTTLSVNPQGSARSGSITVTPAEQSGSVVSVSQTGSVLGALSDTYTTGSGNYTKGDAGYITLGTTTEGLAWQASVSANWISLTGNSGKTWQAAQADSKQFTYSVLYANPFTTEQTATFTVYGGNDNASVNTGLQKAISISQASPYMAVSANPSTISGGGGTSTITVTASDGLGWSASVSGTGYSLNKTSGIGNGTLTLTATSSAASTGTVTITAQKGGHGGSGTLNSKSVSVTKSSGSINLKPNDPTDNTWDNDFRLETVDVTIFGTTVKALKIKGCGSGAVFDNNGVITTQGKSLLILPAGNYSGPVSLGTDAQIQFHANDIVPSSDLGDGLSNHLNLLYSTEYLAAQYCRHISQSWYLPTANQWKAISKNLVNEYKLKGNGYWCSTWGNGMVYKFAEGDGTWTSRAQSVGDVRCVQNVD